jgi:hypothetical protein
VPFREYLVNHIGGGKRGSADICAYFFLRAHASLSSGGLFGLIATNTIAQGDTREVGLDQIVREDGCIIRAIPSRPWPGVASLEVAHVWGRKGVWKGACNLDDKIVDAVSAFLTTPGTVTGIPYRLKANEGKSFQGSIVLGMGFVLTPEEAQNLIEKDPRNQNVLFPYLNGEDLNSRPDQSPSRWVINFFDWSIEKAMEYPDCFRIVEEKVKPERQRKKPNGEFALRKPLPQNWWIYAEKRPALYRTIANMKRVLVTARVSKYQLFSFCNCGIIASEATVMISQSSSSFFAALCTSVHEVWTQSFQSSLETRGRYTPSDCFETFPFPESLECLERVGSIYYSQRQEVMLSRQEGLTATFNRFHDADECSPDIQKLRDLHVEMDNAVAAAYGWTDLELNHGFHDTKQGIRFTISEPARREVLQRLLKLNHERYDEEVKQGLHGKKGGAKKSAPKKKVGVKLAKQEASLFDVEDDE